MTTTTLDPDSLVLGELMIVPGVSSLMGTGEVAFDGVPGVSSIVATMDGTVPVADGAGERRFCQFCVEEVRLSPGTDLPTDVFSDRPGDAYEDLNWTIASEGGAINANMAIEQDPQTGLNVMKDPPEIESISVIAAIDVPRDSLNADSRLVAGPDGCVLEIVEGGVVLQEGSARLVSG